MIRLPILALLLASWLPAAPPPGAAAESAYFYVHTVAEMDKSLAFYRDALGLKTRTVLSAFPSDRLSKNEQINALANTPGASFRPVYFELPGNDYGFELLQFAGIDRNPVRPRLQNPGATFLILQVRNLAVTLDKVTKGGGEIVERRSPRSAFVRDPDGFYLLLEQRKSAGASVGVVVADTAAAQRFYQDMLGFVPAQDGGSAKIPGSTFEIQFRAVKAEQKAIHPRMQDPGASQFTLQFREPAAARAFLKTAGVEFLSPGVIYDPNGVLILVRGEPPNH